MPYEWTAPDDQNSKARLRLWPHRSLPRRGFVVVIFSTFALITIPLYPLLGTVVLWGLLPFLLLVVAGLWWGLERSYRDADLREELTIDPQQIHLRRVDSDGSLREWECNSYWARIKIHPTAGPVAHYITLKGQNREVEIGAFLSEDERKVLYNEIAEALRAAVSE